MEIENLRTCITLTTHCLFLKVHDPIFQKFGFLFHLKNHHSKYVNLRFRLKWSSRTYKAILYIAAKTYTLYYSLSVVPIIRQIFINIGLQAECFSAVKFAMEYEKM